MTRSLNLAAIAAITFTGLTNATAQDLYRPANGDSCRCTTSETSAYLPTDSSYYDQGRCGVGGCSPSSQDNYGYGQRYQQRTPSRYGPPASRARRSPTIPREMAGIARLSVSEQHAALQQRTCPVTKQPLGSMGTPMRVRVAGQSLFVCCEGCVSRLQNNPQQYLGTVRPPTRAYDRARDDSFASLSRQSQQPAVRIPREMEGVALLPRGEQQAALQQRTCPVTKQPLGSMGKPMRVNVGGRTVYVCCKGCVNKLKNAPAQYLTGRTSSAMLYR